MALYSTLLMTALVLGAPWWLWRMATSGRYRAGLAGRLGRVPQVLVDAVRGRDVIWVHCVSVGEVLGAARLIEEMQAALPGYVIAVSTTTATGQEIAKQKLRGVPVFFMPLDFAFVVRRYLRVLRPRLMVLMESELWPRLMYECERSAVPVAVVNARVSDRSFRRAVRASAVWGRVLRWVGMFVAQSEEDARRLVAMGAHTGAVRVGGNLKYDVRANAESVLAGLVRSAAAGRPIVVAGSTVEGDPVDEEMRVIQAWEGLVRRELGALLVLAPRHPQRFGVVESLVSEFSYCKAGDWGEVKKSTPPFADDAKDGAPRKFRAVDVVLLDTIGDLASVYGIADVAFVGGSLVRRGGHNPLEPARFGIPVVMGPSFENFREIVKTMQAADGIRIVPDADGLKSALVDLLTHTEAAKAMGERGRQVFESQSGATGRTVEALLGLIAERGR